MRRDLCISLLPYGEAVLVVAVATIIRLMLDPWLGRWQMFSWYYMAVAIATWFGGWRCSLLAGALGYVAADWFFIEPRHVLNSLLTGKTGLSLVSYATVCTAIAVCMEAIRCQAPIIVFRLDLDDGLDLLDLASAVRTHAIEPQELPDYLEGLNVSARASKLALHFAQRTGSPRELAMSLESFAKGSGPIRTFST